MHLSTIKGSPCTQQVDKSVRTAFASLVVVRGVEENSLSSMSPGSICQKKAVKVLHAQHRDMLCCSLQGLNIAPALIAIAPTREVINPVGPLSISDLLVDATVPQTPGP